MYVMHAGLQLLTPLIWHCMQASHEHMQLVTMYRRVPTVHCSAAFKHVLAPINKINKNSCLIRSNGCTVSVSEYCCKLTLHVMALYYVSDQLPSQTTVGEDFPCRHHCRCNSCCRPCLVMYTPGLSGTYMTLSSARAASRLVPQFWTVRPYSVATTLNRA